ncbi:MAG TPA: MFS transporter [Spirochaetia bacterium]|nr:MFS transporter [Spirochaetia bacterium]
MPSRPIRASFLANYFFLFITYAVLAPYLQLYLKARGMSPSRIGILLGSLEVAGLAGPILLGRLADRSSGYRALLAGCILVPVIAFIPMELTTRFPLYLACVVAMGFAYRATTPLLDSLVSRILPDPARQYGKFRTAGSVGFILVSLLFQFTGLVSGESSVSILLAFVVTAVCAALVVGTLPRSPRTGPRPAPNAAAKEHAGAQPHMYDGFDGKFWAVIAVIFLGRFGIGAYYSFFSLYLQQTFPRSGVSIFWAIGSIAEIATMWFSGALIRRWGLRVLLVISLAAISLRLGLFVIAPTLLVVCLAQLLHALTFGTFHTSAVAYVNLKIEHDRRGTGMAIYNAVGIGLPSFLASVAGGYILEAHGFVVLFLSYAAFPIVGIAVLAAFGKRLLPGTRPIGA